MNSLLHLHPFVISRCDDLLRDVVHVKLSVARAETDLSRKRGTVPSEVIDRAGRDLSRHDGDLLVFQHRAVMNRLSSHLDVLIQVPQIKRPGRVDRAKHRRMIRVPLDVKHVVVRPFKRMHRRDSADLLHPRFPPPQLDRPIHRTRQEQVGKVNRTRAGMEMQSCDGSSVAAINVVGSCGQTGLCGSSVVPVRLVDAAFFCSDPEGGRVVVGEVETCDGDFVGLAMGRCCEG